MKARGKSSRPLQVTAVALNPMGCKTKYDFFRIFLIQKTHCRERRALKNLGRSLERIGNNFPRLMIVAVLKFEALQDWTEPGL